ncbi:MAG: ABC transporter permease subunit [Armatimonadota bacterium]|nr:ABC transporter permease subunit [Armatimonadota bacterium]
MANAQEDILRPRGSPPAVPLVGFPAGSLARRRAFADRLARRFVTLGGILVIASILAIFAVIVSQVLPLFRSPRATPARSVQVAGGEAALAVGVDEHRQVIYLVTPSGVQFVSAEDGSTLTVARPEELGRARITATSALGRGQFGLGLSDGRMIPATVQFDVSFPDGRRHVTARLVAGAPIVADEAGRQISRLAFAATPKGMLAAVVSGPRELTIVGVVERKALIGTATREQTRRAVAIPVAGEITQLAADSRGDHVYVGTSTGQVASVAVGEPDSPRVDGVIEAASAPGVGISALALLLGDRTLLVGDERGAVSSWLILPDVPPAGLKKAHDYRAHARPVVALAPSRRDKGFLSLDAGGAIHLNYATTGRTLLAFSAGTAGTHALTFAPKADGLVVAGADGTLAEWELANPHPQITWQTLFGRVLYEGYKEPDFVWQSTGATDDFEEKFSLTPLVYGTLKGTFYAMLVAVPLAVLGALYASQFMHPTLRGVVKPVVEIMAALPSVVLGFLAGLWLAPTIERIAPGVFLIPVVVPLAIIAAVVAWRQLPPGVRQRVRPGSEVVLIVPTVLLAIWAALRLGVVVEHGLLGGDYRAWLLGTLGVTYDQRNSLVVGFAMGFAVIPIIFTIAEDALSNVPPYLAAGSLALGATRWQTALRVVLPTASPGIFSAIMIGFGRAVGETMIVVMATGNTPVMDWSIFNGFRALSANIAVELPEAPQGGTLYRVLFLAALLLFVMTFLVNTAAEMVRLRLRKRYQAI